VRTGPLEGCLTDILLIEEKTRNLQEEIEIKAIHIIHIDQVLIIKRTG